jgi:CBS domain-containing protein
MNISEAMTPDPACCIRGDTVQAAAIIMRELSVGVVPVVDSEESQKLVGVITDRDLCMDVVAEGKHPATMKVEDCMTTELITCHPNDEIEQVAHMMQQNQIRRVPVVDDEFHLKGIISMADIVLCGDLPSAEIDETMRDISEPSFEEFQRLTRLDAIKTEEQ